MYLSLLALHSILRWVVLAAGVIAVARAVSGASGHRPWTPADGRAGRWFVIALDAQTLIGLILYVALSPLTTAAMRDMGAAMANPSLRFWAVEHVFGMLAAVALAHIGRARVRKAAHDAARHRYAVIFFLLSLAVLLASIPWPGMTNARPLFPGL